MIDEKEIRQTIVKQIEYIGEDVNREGLLKTPDRIIRAWKEIFSGYQEKSEDIFTTFDTDSYDQIVLLKDIEMYAMCEHHLLP